MSQAKKKKLYYMMVVCCLLGFKFGTLGLELLILPEQSKLPTETMRLFLYLLNHVDITHRNHIPRIVSSKYFFVQSCVFSLHHLPITSLQILVPV